MQSRQNAPILPVNVATMAGGIDPGYPDMP
ncbi:hypothetical protein X739_31415 [Mesorhizobium sp. LNHC220B00]|nr:hypothetical protein X739_31415 [Mesorhizobium sp. LNHC220B00]